jgi:hypothetical protein
MKVICTTLQKVELMLMPTISLQQYMTFITSYKGKAIPLQAWTGPDGSRRLRLPDFMTVGT